MEITSFILALISLLVSFGISIYGFVFTKKINDINLDSQYIYELYKKHMTRRIPKAKKSIDFSESKLQNTKELKNELIAVWHDFDFCKYVDEEFYKSLKKACQDTEDFLVQKTGEIFEQEEQAVFWNELNEKLKVVYQSVNRKYKNGK